MLQGIHHKSSYNMHSYTKSDVPRLVPIAPATEAKYNMEPEKKKYNYKSNPYVGAQAASIARRNARERNRVKQVNDGFNALRKKLPASVIAALSGGARRGSGKKLSKVDTLRMVVEYIRHLQSLLEESDGAMGVPKSNVHITPMDTSLCYEDEGVYGGSSPYSDSVPSPVGSECSSGVSVYSNNGYIANNYPINEQFTAVNDDDLLDTISWWQHK
ncbi:achaete-scute complex protein T3-like [Ostrinia furnacalis]|uniref:achaete-scute complex protein T3-like n=1 Tax=Ostrinia furnacalis TaxID=93504 RepID=UPI00103FDB8A|nr:achaete-scute complex protein T3-like [Ostrinia furnacalis]